MVQESLTNIARHARASHVRVELKRGVDGILVRIADNGAGFNAGDVFSRRTEQPTAGLLGMRERVQLLGGELSIDSAWGSGTTVTARIPDRIPARSTNQRWSGTMERVRVLLVDDHDLVRTGVRLVLQRLEGVEVVGEAGDGAKRSVWWKPCPRPRVHGHHDALPERSGGAQAHRTEVSADAGRRVVDELQRGVCAAVPVLRGQRYLVKNISPAELDTAIRTVMGGETYISPEVSRHPDLAAFRRGGGANLDQTSYDRLTPRQREVLQLIAEGHSTKEIARKLDISVKTVEMHRSQLMTSLDIHDVAGLVRYAIRRGIVSPDR